METRELHLELLLGTQVRDASGKVVGSIEEIRAVQQDEDWVIQEYLIGTAALMERLSAWNVGMGILRLLGARKLSSGYCIPWHKLDLSDPEHPRLNCDLDELEVLS